MPYLKKNIFHRKNLNYLLSRIEKNSVPDLKDRQDVINDWINYIQSGNIDFTKETALQGKFLDDIFSKALGYKSRIKNTEQWNLNQEQLTTIDSKFADGSLGFFSKSKEDVRVVIELKGSNISLDEKQHRHNDTRTPIEQAFSYQHKIGSKCKWIIVSNYKEIRLYHHSSSTEFEVFNITELGNWEEFRRFYYLLAVENLISISGDSIIDTLYAKNEVEEVNISKQFYLDFKEIRTKLFEHLKQNNPDKPELMLLEKTQKFLDRFIFLSFCEDNRLLPEKTFKKIIERGKQSYSFSETKIWNELKGLFQAINDGSPPHNINKFNGGLFANDAELDELSIQDIILEEIAKLTEYDFETDVDVNILGHIFEQSISDIEEIKSSIEGKGFDKKTSKRKKDGIYYTPEYITKYIVENAVGGWLDDRKKELGYYELPEISNEDFQAVKNVKGKIQLNEKLQKHLEFWQAYKVKLMEIKVLDPACGSGAFLNQAFNFLYAEGQTVNDKIAEFSGGQTELFGFDKHILSNNLFGVDLNNESVEITKLSLWIKTANAHAELTALDNNIKCGNSLIDDPAIAGDKAFNWNNEFQEIMQNGGFDVVIGNPPYGIVQDKQQEDYFRIYYPLTNYKTNLYLLFIERMIKLCQSSTIQFIIPKSLLFNVFYSKIREYLIKYCSIEELFTLEEKVFSNAEVGDSLIIKIRVGSKINTDKLKMVAVDKFENFRIDPDNFTNHIEQEYFLTIPNYEISAFKNKSSSILKKLKTFKTIQDSFTLKNGLNPGNIKHILIHNIKLNDNYKPIIWGKDISRYIISWSGNFVNYDNSLAENLTLDNTVSKSGMRKQEKIDFSLRNKTLFEAEKIVIRKTGDSLIASFDSNNYYFDTLVHGIYSVDAKNLKYLLGIINSKPATFFYRLLHDIKGKVFAKISLEQLAQFPIPSVTDDCKIKLVEFVDNILNNQSLFTNSTSEFLTFIKNKFGIEKATTKLQNWYELEYNEFLTELSKVKVNLPLEEQLSWQALFTKQKALVQELKTKIDETDKKIDAIVYELYELTEEEIKIVEGK